MKKCSYCNAPNVFAKGLCRPCYAQQRRSGSPERMYEAMTQPVTLRVRRRLAEAGWVYHDKPTPHFIHSTPRLKGVNVVPDSPGYYRVYSSQSNGRIIGITHLGKYLQSQFNAGWSGKKGPY